MNMSAIFVTPATASYVTVSLAFNLTPPAELPEASTVMNPVLPFLADMMMLRMASADANASCVPAVATSLANVLIFPVGSDPPPPIVPKGILVFHTDFNITR